MSKNLLPLHVPRRATKILAGAAVDGSGTCYPRGRRICSIRRPYAPMHRPWKLGLGLSRVRSGLGQVVGLGQGLGLHGPKVWADFGLGLVWVTGRV
ncbi:hypothetical protein ACFX2C_012345 [Malus domestica]